MAQVRRMLALNAARKEREDRNEALEALCVLRSKVSSTATLWYLPNRYPPAGRNRLCGRAVTDEAPVAVIECSRWPLAFRLPVRSFRSHFGCADGSGVFVALQDAGRCPKRPRHDRHDPGACACSSSSARRSLSGLTCAGVRARPSAWGCVRRGASGAGRAQTAQA